MFGCEFQTLEICSDQFWDPPSLLSSDRKMFYDQRKCGRSVKLTIQMHIVMDLINALSRNSSVNTVQHAAVKEAVFSISTVTSHKSG
jgi:hypothetical protein